MDLAWILGGSCVDIAWILGGSCVDSYMLPGLRPHGMKSLLAKSIMICESTVNVYILDTCRSPEHLRIALRKFHEVNVVELPGPLDPATGIPHYKAGAKMVVRPEHREKVEQHLRTTATFVKNRLFYFDDFRTRHIIVQDMFKSSVESLILEIPRRHRIKLIWSSLVEVLDVGEGSIFLSCQPSDDHEAHLLGGVLQVIDDPDSSDSP